MNEGLTGSSTGPSPGPGPGLQKGQTGHHTTPGLFLERLTGHKTVPGCLKINIGHPCNPGPVWLVHHRSTVNIPVDESPTNDRRLRDFYHNWTNSILQHLERNFWKITDG